MAVRCVVRPKKYPGPVVIKATESIDCMGIATVGDDQYKIKLLHSSSHPKRVRFVLDRTEEDGGNVSGRVQEIVLVNKTRRLVVIQLQQEEQERLECLFLHIQCNSAGTLQHLENLAHIID